MNLPNTIRAWLVSRPADTEATAAEFREHLERQGERLDGMAERQGERLDGMADAELQELLDELEGRRLLAKCYGEMMGKEIVDTQHGFAERRDGRIRIIGEQPDGDMIDYAMQPPEAGTSDAPRG